MYDSNQAPRILTKWAAVRGAVALVEALSCGCSGADYRDLRGEPATGYGDESRSRSAADRPIEPVATKPPGPETTGGWYGWQVLLADAESIGLLALSFTQDSNPGVQATLMGSAAAGYVLGAPAVHWIQGEKSMAGVSLLLRLGLPLAGGFLGSLQGDGCSDTNESGEFRFCVNLAPALGAVAGMAVAMTIDAVALAHEPVREKRYRPTLAPLFGLRQDGGFLGISGRF